jgi:hypothetical protein
LKGATETLYLADSAIRGIERDVPGDRALPAVAVREESFLVVIELFGCLGRELDVWSQDNGVDRASLLTEAAVDAFHHVDVEAGGPPRDRRRAQGGAADGASASSAPTTIRSAFPLAITPTKFPHRSKAERKPQAHPKGTTSGRIRCFPRCHVGRHRPGIIRYGGRAAQSAGPFTWSIWTRP